MLPEERLAALKAKIPEAPCIEALHIELVEADKGFVRCRARRDRRFDGLMDGFHGGMMAAIVDCVAWFAIATEVGTEELMVTTDLQIRYLNPCVTDLAVNGRVIKLGKTLCPVQLDLYDTTGLHVATAQTTYMRVQNMKSK